MSLSWLSFGYAPGKPEDDSNTPDSTIAGGLKVDSDHVLEDSFEPLQNGQPKKAAYTVESTTVTVTADDSSFDETRSELLETKQSLSTTVIAQQQKRASSLPMDSSKMASTLSVNSTMSEKMSDKPATAIKPTVEALPESRPGSALSKEQLKANISPRISPHIMPRERTNSVTSTTSSNWRQRLNATSKATAAAHSTGISVSGDIQSHPSGTASSMLGDHDADSLSVLTASPALSAIDKLTLQRTRSLDLKSDTTHSNEGAEPEHGSHPNPTGGSAGGDGDDDGNGDDDNKQPRKSEDTVSSAKGESGSDDKSDVKISDQVSGEQHPQKPTNESNGTLWSWFAKNKSEPTQPAKEMENKAGADPDSSITAPVNQVPPTESVNIPNADQKPKASAAQMPLNNTPESSATHPSSHTSSSWGFFFSNTSNAEKIPQSLAMEKTASQTESVKSTAVSTKEAATSATETISNGPKQSGVDNEKKSNVSVIKDEDSSLKKKGSRTSLMSTSKSSSSQRTGSAPTKAEEDQSKQVVIIERSASQDKASDTASVTQSSEVNGVKTTSTSNVVLPSFNSQFTYTPTIDGVSNSTSTSLLNKALSAINGLFASKVHKSYSSHDNLSRLRGMNEKMAHFIQDMQLEPETVAGKRFVIVGVHGWFPMKLVRSMIGEPTGTSTKFCEQMVKGLRQYFTSTHGISIPDDAITSIPLEGEGKVEDRVQRLYDALLGNSQWLDAISSADVILWATHSQGTPVSSLLLKRLLHEGHIHMGRQQCCVLAMAGISQGPFPALKGNLIVKYFEADAARELFEFMDSTSEISQKFRKSLTGNLRSGVRMVLIGSMQDQVVPLYSAVMSSASHSNLFRAIYIDGHVYNEDDFLINLIIFALRLRNAGVSDHGLLIHVSEVLAGNLYALEGGHSTVYEEVEVYTMAARYLFETAPFGKMTIAACGPPPPPAAKSEQDIVKAGEPVATSHSKHLPSVENEEPEMEPFQARLRLNPFYLPWAMRGICDDARILNDKILNQELERLRALFEKWNPISAKLREIKFRLEPLKARL